MQTPRGPSDLYCPTWRKPMSKVCHTCPLWTQVRGKNPNTGQDVDQWNCSLAFLPMLLIETSQQVRQAGAATESMRNEMVAIHVQTTEAHRTAAAIAERSGRMKLIDGGKE